MKNKIFGIIWVIIISVSGCNTKEDDTPPNPGKTGVFLDSAVANIGYRTETQSGVTNEFGEYKYLDGETVTFFIGALDLPAVAATGRLTPIELAYSENISDNAVVNISRLLQTLDKDADPTNGITITQAAKDIATEYATSLEGFSFSGLKDDFANDPVIDAIIKNGGQDTAPTALVSEVDAINHLQTTIDNLSFDAATLSGLYHLTSLFDDGDDIHEYTFNMTNNTVNIVYADGTNDTENWTVNSLGKLRITGSVDDTFVLTSGTQENGELSIILSDEDGTVTTTGTITKI